MSDNKGLENTKYKLIKNEDKLILTDKKTLKSRVLEIDDIDYVVDDNQRLRDPNVIENYFRLKDESYEPKMMTKTADYVKEQKEVEKLYSPMKYEDLIDEYIKKYNLTKMEIEKFSQIPDESTIKKLYGRTEEEKKTMINDFKILKKKLTENKNLGADIFTYLKSYFSNYSYNTALMDLYDKISFDVYIKDKSFYKDKEDYEKIKNEKITSLQDLYNKGINYFGGIKLKFLDNLLKKYLDITGICQDNEQYFVYDSNHLVDAFGYKYVNDLNLMVKDKGKGGGEEENNRAFKDAVELYNKLSSDDKKLFDDWMKTDFKDFQDKANMYFETEKTNQNLLEIYSKVINEEVFKRFKSKNNTEEVRNEHVKNVDTQIGDVKKEEINSSSIKGYLSIHNDIIAELYKRTDSFKKMSPIDKDERYDTIIDFISRLVIEGLNYFDTNFKIQILINEINKHEDKLLPYKIGARLWSKKGKTGKISLESSPREYVSGKYEKLTQENTGCNDSGGVLAKFYNFVLKPILDIVMTDVEMASGNLNNKSLGWTDKTLTRIEKITDTLKDVSNSSSGKPVAHLVGVSAGWTDKTLTRIEKITDTLREYSSGRINPALLKVMNSTASGLKMSAGWTDNTLTRIEKINETLREYI